MDRGRADEAGVLIVGAGPVGLSLACELLRHGVDCRIIDQSAGPTDQSRAFGIQARTLEVFEAIGVVGEILDRGLPLHGIGVYSDGHRVAHVRLDFEGLDTHYPVILSLPQGETERVLVDGLARLGGSVERRTTLRSFVRDESGVTATLADASGATREVRARWLVGCDGARSTVRHALAVPFEGKEYEEAFLLADVRLDWDGPGDEITMIASSGSPVAVFPAPGGRSRLIEIGTTMTTDDPEAVAAHFQERLRGEGFPAAVVRDPGWTSVFKIHRRLASARYRRRRGCFLAGDAAHIHSPAGGQGMNTGIQDAFNLAWKLALVDAGEAPESLLDSYTIERRPVAAAVERGADTMTRMAMIRGALARTIRNRALSVLTEFDFVRSQLTRGLSELEVSYRRSPIVAEDHPSLLATLLPGHDHPSIHDAQEFLSGPHPGDRAPDVMLDPTSGAPARLFDLLRGTGHTLLLFLGTREPGDPVGLESSGRLARTRFASRIAAHLIVPARLAPEALPISWGGPTIRDPDDALHDRFGARSACLYLIRPDGHVAYRAQPPDPDKLRAYLGRIFE